MNEFLKTSYLLAPLLLGLAFHGLCIKFGWLGWFARPIDAGRMLGGKRLFGDNKTYRGVIAVGLGTAAGVGLQGLFHQFSGVQTIELVNFGMPASLGLGLAMGVAAMLSELPNSLLKRQLGIRPGAAGRGLVGVAFFVLDQIDMLFGVWVVVGFFVAITPMRLLWSMVFLFIAHQVLTVVGYQLGMRATAR